MTTSSSERLEGLPRPDGRGERSRGWRIEIQSKSEPTTYTCGEDEILLQAGLRNALTLPYECATGTCGTCRARVMSGEVVTAWADAPAHAKIKRDRGDILMCQTRPLSDCVLRIPAIVKPETSAYAVPAHHRGTVARVTRLTADVIHFDVLLSEPMGFDAGQFVVLRVPGLEGARAYSMVNHAHRSDRLELVVKRKNAGGFSTWLFDELPRGQEIDLFGPLGRATFHPEEAADLILVAGGSGIAGMMSILSRATAEGYFQNHKGRVFFGVRSLRDGFYLDVFSRHLEAAGSNLDVTLALSDEAASSAFHPVHARIRLASGMVHDVCASGLACGPEVAVTERLSDPIGYVAGPPPMVDGVLRVLLAGGHCAPGRIRYDKFG